MKLRYKIAAVVMWLSLPVLAYIGDPSLFAPRYYPYVAALFVIWAVVSAMAAWVVENLIWAIKFSMGEGA